MTGVAVVLRRMLVFRGVAAAHVAADQAHAQVNPSVAHLQALLAAVGVRGNVANLIQVCTYRRHAQLDASPPIASQNQRPRAGRTRSVPARGFLLCGVEMAADRLQMRSEKLLPVDFAVVQYRGAPGADEVRILYPDERQNCPQYGSTKLKEAMADPSLYTPPEATSTVAFFPFNKPSGAPPA